MALQSIKYSSQNLFCFSVTQTHHLQFWFIFTLEKHPGGHLNLIFKIVYFSTFTCYNYFGVYTYTRKRVIIDELTDIPILEYISKNVSKDYVH